MKYAVVAAWLVVGADALLQAIGKRALIERALGNRYANPWLRLPLVAVYLGLIVLMVSNGFRSWPWPFGR